LIFVNVFPLLEGSAIIFLYRIFLYFYEVIKYRVYHLLLMANKKVAKFTIN